MRSLLVTVSLAALTLAASPALAQTEDAPPPGRRGGAGGAGGSPDQFIQRMMERDANGDGKLQRDELPGRFADRLFEAGDTNGDDVIDEAELRALAASGAFGRGGRGGQGGRGGAGGGGQGGQGGDGASGAQMSFGQSMRLAGRGLRGLSRSEFTAETMERDMQAIQSVQLGLIQAKGRLDTIEMSEKARAKYGADTKTFARDFRMSLLKAVNETLEIEMALAEGNGDKARAHLMRLQELQDSSHDLFQGENEGRGRGRGQGRGRDITQADDAAPAGANAAPATS